MAARTLAPFLRRLPHCLLLALLAIPALPVRSQDYPARTVTLTMPYAPGGPGDAITRLFAGALQKVLGQQFVVDNPAGASGTIGTAKVARSKPDGYTLLMIHVSHATNAAMYRNLPYSPVDDFEPIGRTTNGPMLVVARPGFPAANLQELLQTLRNRGASLSLAHAGVGSASHLCSLLMMNALKVKFNEIPYKGTGPALTDLIGGQVDIMCDQTSGTLPQVRAGKIRAYAVAGKTRLPQLPDVPAIAEAGVDGVDINISFGMYAPKGTPRPIIDKLSEALQKAVTDIEVLARLDAMGLSAVSADQARPEALRAHLKQEMDTLVPLLTRAGVQAN